MIDILQKLREYEEKGHNVGDAIKNVEKTNPAQTEGAVKSMLMDIEQDAVELSKEEFIKKHNGKHMDIWNRVQKEKEEVGENKMKKESVNESITISTDSPQEASMMMQILKLAGVKPVDQDMINQPEKNSCGCDSDCSCQQEEAYANEPDTKTQSVDDLVNLHSGGLNRQKQQFAKSQDGDNAMAVENLADSLRKQYTEFKTNYEKAVNEAKQVAEKKLTKAEKKKKEEIVKSMKKDMPDMKKRYGKKAKEVAYATATKIAKKKA